jgi:serine/threonine protein kinase
MDKSQNFIKENSIIFKKYKIKSKLGEGAFGDVYIGSCIETNELVAIKVEQKKILKPLLDKSLFDIFNERRKRLALEDICLIAIQVIDRIHWVHSKNIKLKVN